MSKVIIMKGLPGSGKSEKAKEILTNGNTVRINKDLIRTMLHFDKFTGVNEGHTRDAARKLADWFLRSGVNVIIDDTNLNERTLQSWVDFAKLQEAKIEYCDLTDVDVETCIARDAVREKKVGAHVIQKMALQYLDYMKGEPVIVCDLDGTLCDIKHRLMYAKGEMKNWNTFFSLIHADSLRSEVLKNVHGSVIANDAKLILVSARPETYRKETEEWLARNGVVYEFLIMREENDKRDDTEVKSDIYDKFLKNLRVCVVFDDRPKVIRMWREKGLEVIDVGEGIEF